MSTSQIGIRIDDKDKRELEKNAKAIGLTAASAIKMMIFKFNHDKGFSYPINRKDSANDGRGLPSEVEKAMIKALAEEYGLIDDTSEKVNNIDELRKRWGR